ncbi:DUF7385 family protein [Halodesulfurarchaeum sp.]|uniref:DUF7385 family protein n=1 Tax=Halodesulfurarchaeum sp. TaxID=1980530 RepID=UPI001BC82650|nr:flagella cluster protein [Halodesulfurarchaeum sp.]
MPTLAVEDGFSVHDYRAGLKLLEQDGSTMTLENREGYTCPVSGDVFDRLLVAEDQALSFSSPPPEPICVRSTPEKILVLAH